MNKRIINNGLFICEENDKFQCLFSTAENKVSYSLSDSSLESKFKMISDYLNLDDIMYLKQIHSDKIFEYDNSIKFKGDKEGDALITNIRNVAIGVFTADCVPVLIVDEIQGVCAAVHSGWKGTINNIVGKTLSRMIDDYNCKKEDLKVYIGPHNKSCCYEVSEELIKEFKSVDIFMNEDINSGRYLNLENCIIIQCRNIGINKGNINKSDYCTFCSDEILFHSYRKENTNAGRQFSFVYIK